MFPAGRSDVATRAVDLAGGITLRVAESGNRDSPVILLLHGWGASIYMWRDWVAPPAPAGYRALSIDPPGHGPSEKAHRVGGDTFSGVGWAGRPVPGLGGNGHGRPGAQPSGGPDP